MVSTDLHGNWRDFLTLRVIYEQARGTGEAHWVLLGDLVHGPNEAAGQQEPELYNYPDESPRLIDALCELRSMHPNHVHFVLGNHDAGHAGFGHTSKFHPNEVTALERRLSSSQVERLRRLCDEALLAVVTPAGLLMSHGAPGDELTALSLLDGPFPVGVEDTARFRAVHEVLWSYGQPGPVAAAMLERLSVETGLRLRVVVHGHDRDQQGWYVEGGNQLQPVLFGAPDENKRYLWVDLAEPVNGADDLAKTALRRLHGPPPA
jgi:hypothetical protein